MKKRVQIYYSGNVQGVGFRFTAEYVARDKFLTGWVKNLSDGRVEIVFEGDENSINEFMNILGDRMARYIKDVDVSWQSYKGEFKDFTIRFY